jgi:hypothetical protein
MSDRACIEMNLACWYKKWKLWLHRWVGGCSDLDGVFEKNLRIGTSSRLM